MRIDPVKPDSAIVPPPGLPPEARVIDRRRHQRVSVNLLGRYMLADRQEYPCQVTDISPGGAALVAPVVGIRGERVVCYLDHIGRIEGTIVRQLPVGFALQMTVPLIKREKLADQLTWLANRNDLGMPEDRRHERIAPKNPRSTLLAADGTYYPVRLIDISISGAAMTCDQRPPVGSAVTIGRTPARVVRVSPTGIAVEFARLLPAEQFSDQIEI
jgi:hypothetical protein